MDIMKLTGYIAFFSDIVLDYITALHTIRNEQKVFEDNYYTKAETTYAAIVAHPFKANEFAVEFGRKNTSKIVLLNAGTADGKSSLDGFTTLSKTEESDLLLGVPESAEFAIGPENSKNALRTLYSENLPDTLFAEYVFLNAGISIGKKDDELISGTLGGSFLSQDNVLYGISNAHIFGRHKNIIGTKVTHPSLMDDKLMNIKDIGEIEWAEYDDEADAVFIRLNKNGTALLFNNFVNERLNLKHPITPKIGMKVKKIGKSSGLTKGEILSTNATICLEAGAKAERKIYRNQIMTNVQVNKGDSGSLLVSETNHVLGLISMNNNTNTRSFANAIETIFSKSHIKFKDHINFLNTHRHGNHSWRHFKGV